MSHYETVGVSPDASDEEIKQAYKKRAGKLHPDKPSGDTEKFKDLNHAYSVLSDETRKLEYDKTGTDEKPKDYMSKASINLGQIFLRIISSEQKGDLVQMVTDEINNSLIQAKQNREKVNQLVIKFELLIDRVVTKSKTNMCNHTIEQQIKGLNLQLKSFDDFIKIGDLMIILLDDYSDSKPDLIETSNPWINVTTHHIGIVSRSTFP